MIGGQIRDLFGYQRMLDAIGKDLYLFGPWAIAATWQSALLDTLLAPVKAAARLAVGASRNPDAIADANGWIYKNYSRLLYTLTRFLSEMANLIAKKRPGSTTAKGKDYLKTTWMSSANWSVCIITSA